MAELTPKTVRVGLTKDHWPDDSIPEIDLSRCRLCAEKVEKLTRKRRIFRSLFSSPEGRWIRLDRYPGKTPYGRYTVVHAWYAKTEELQEWPLHCPEAQFRPDPSKNPDGVHIEALLDRDPSFKLGFTFGRFFEKLDRVRATIAQFRRPPASAEVSGHEIADGVAPPTGSSSTRSSIPPERHVLSRSVDIESVPIPVLSSGFSAPGEPSPARFSPESLVHRTPEPSSFSEPAQNEAESSGESQQAVQSDETRSRASSQLSPIGPCDPRSIANELRKRRKLKQARLVEYMADRDDATADEIAEHIHQDPDASEKTMRENARRTNQSLAEMNVPLLFRFLGAHMFREINPE